MSSASKLAALVLSLRKFYGEWNASIRKRPGKSTDADFEHLRMEVDKLCHAVWGELPPISMEGKREVIVGHNILHWPSGAAEMFVDTAWMLTVPQKIAFLRSVEALRLEHTDEARDAWHTIFDKEPFYTYSAFTLSQRGTELHCWHSVPVMIDDSPKSFWWVGADKETISLFVDALVPKAYQKLEGRNGATYWLPY